MTPQIYSDSELTPSNGNKHLNGANSASNNRLTMLAVTSWAANNNLLLVLIAEKIQREQDSEFIGHFSTEMLRILLL